MSYRHPYDTNYQGSALPVIKVTIENPITGHRVIDKKAVVDSGGDDVMIPETILTSNLRVVPISFRDVGDFEGASKRKRTYEVNISFGIFNFRRIEVIGSDGDEIIIGRPILNTFATLLDGRNLQTEIT